MSIITKESIADTIEGLEHLANSGIQSVYIDMAIAGMRRLLASLEAEPVTEWTNEQCLEFMSIAFRHAEIKGDLELDDIRLGVKMVNGSRAAVLQGADGSSPVIPDGWVLVPVDMPHEMMRAVQVNSELGAYAATNLNGAYSLFREFWDVAVTAAPQQEMNT
jgi:hypothetical protein